MARRRRGRGGGGGRARGEGGEGRGGGRRGGSGGGRWPRRLLRGVRRFPWLCNVLLYGGLFAAGDAAQQLLRGQPPDWAQTRRVALVALAFHGNFSYVWLRALERALPGRRPPAVLGKVLCDQLLGAPVAVLAFYTGMSILQRKEDIFSDCKKKFWNTYKTGLMYWPFVQLSNFILIPVHLRTAYTGLCGFVWATFICFSQQSGDGTAKSAFMWLQGEKVNADEESSDK
ncbi:LOW QUALITY PROTEIN: mpv17-like protein [Corvus cornix cornix]|nr:LOW QUALITY PROTEIN: mpv17-like protein [Corvus cornix cornix]